MFPVCPPNGRTARSRIRRGINGPVGALAGWGGSTNVQGEYQDMPLARPLVSVHKLLIYNDLSLPTSAGGSGGKTPRISRIPLINMNI